MSRQSNLDAVLCVKGCLKLKHNLWLVFDPTYPYTDQSIFCECDWTDFDEGTVEAIPPKAPLPRGKEVDLHLFIGSNHSSKKQTKNWVHDMN